MTLVFSLVKKKKKCHILKCKGPGSAFLYSYVDVCAVVYLYSTFIYSSDDGKRWNLKAARPHYFLRFLEEMKPSLKRRHDNQVDGNVKIG